MDPPGIKGTSRVSCMDTGSCVLEQGLDLIGAPGSPGGSPTFSQIARKKRLKVGISGSNDGLNVNEVMCCTHSSEATLPQEWYHRAVARTPSVLGLACPVLPHPPAKETDGAIPQGK